MNVEEAKVKPPSTVTHFITSSYRDDEVVVTSTVIQSMSMDLLWCVVLNTLWTDW